MTLTMQFDSSGVRNSPLARFSWTKATTTWADGTGPRVRTALKNKAPIGQGPQAGRLKDAIRYSRQAGAGSVSLRWEANVPYLPYVLDGTRPHTITPKAARTLRWVWGGHAPGAFMFAKSVNHPGTRANRFNERAVLPLIPELQKQFRAAVEAAMEGL